MNKNSLHNLATTLHFFHAIIGKLLKTYSSTVDYLANHKAIKLAEWRRHVYKCCRVNKIKQHIRSISVTRQCCFDIAADAVDDDCIIEAHALSSHVTS